MSLVVTAQTFAMMAAPSPASKITDAARRLLHPYLAMLDFSDNWGFFAPIVTPGVQFRYIVEDVAGKRETFVPADSMSAYTPVAFWFKDFYRGVMREPELFADATGLRLCAQHVAMQPVFVTLLQVQQKRFRPENWLDGKKPLDAEFVEITPLKTVQCPTN